MGESDGGCVEAPDQAVGEDVCLRDFSHTPADDGLVTTSVGASIAQSPSLSERLADAAAAIEQLPAGVPAIVRLAHAFNGFYVARVVTVVLDAEAVPRHDVFALAEQWCTQALDVLHDAVGRRLVRRYCPIYVAGEPLLQEITAAAQLEMHAASDVDVDRIGAEMIHLADALRRLLTAVANDENTLPDLCAAASAVVPAADNIWSQYGGDGGGW